jgi:pseudouridine-5'-phosphate glycosidase
MVVVLPEVREALAAHRPVVALESTVIAHGLPYPQNVKLARQMEDVARSEGAVPATIAILGGAPCVGLTGEQVEHLATGKNIAKVSRRDVAVCMAQQRDGATTVSATMLLAHHAGIKVFATGGIGGVHRGNANDISADLTELARTPVVVVCAGAKAILDLGATLEWLETAGVPVIGLGVDEFPAFYSRTSGLPVDARADTVEQAAAIVRAHWGMGLASGVLVAVPIPQADEVAPAAIETAIARALAEAEAEGLRGKAVTPFLLRRVSELTGGESLRANLVLLLNNARVAAQLASCLAAPP